MSIEIDPSGDWTEEERSDTFARYTRPVPAEMEDLALELGQFDKDGGWRVSIRVMHEEVYSEDSLSKEAAEAKLCAWMRILAIKNRPERVTLSFNLPLSKPHLWGEWFRLTRAVKTGKHSF